jgi:phospholipase C
VLLAAFAGSAAAQVPDGLGRIERFVVIFLENRSFDNLFGLFPGANGLAQAQPERTIQVDLQGRPYPTLPVRAKGVPPQLDNRPFLIDPYIPLDKKDPSPTHLFYHQQAQINGGRMNKFAALSSVGGFAMGYHDGSNTRLWEWARQYTLADNFFHAAFGGSFLNHFWLMCACTPRFPNAPPEIVTRFGPNGEVLKDNGVTPDGYAVNTLFSVYQPHPADTDPRQLVPPQTAPTIGDRLNEKGIGWAWYSGGWNAAVAGHPSRDFQFHHQPFAYFRNYGDGTEARRRHLKDETDLYAAIDSGTLPAVSFYKPIGRDNEHPGYASIAEGDARVADLLYRLASSPMFGSMAIIVTYDENGGFWDHVPPPAIDRWGPGTRVPTVIISPFSRRGFVDSTMYDTTSILRIIETRYGLAPLADRDVRANNMLNAFAFTP